MSVLQPWLLTQEMLSKMIADALGGDVWVAEDRLHWRPEGHERVVSLPHHEMSQPFDGDEWAAALREAWAKSGCRL